MLIAAQANGLGAVWLAIYPRQERGMIIQELLKLPEHIVPLCIVAIGYPAEKKISKNRFDPSRVHWNVW
jgi:nitroreductase